MDFLHALRATRRGARVLLALRPPRVASALGKGQFFKPGFVAQLRRLLTGSMPDIA